MTTKFEEFEPGGLSLKDLRNELEVIDRAIDLLRETKNVNTLVGGGGGGTHVAGRVPGGMVGSMAKARGIGTLQSLSASASNRRERATASKSTTNHHTNNHVGGGTNDHTTGGRDASYLIDTTSVQMGTCPHCFEEMPLTKLRKHLYSGPGSTGASSSSSCPNMDMRCPEEGCNAVFPAKSLRRHLNRECLVAKRRRLLVESGIKRKEDLREQERLAAIAAVAAAVEAAAAAERRPPTVPGDENTWWGRGGVDAEEAQQLEVVCDKCNESMRQSLLPDHQQTQVTQSTDSQPTLSQHPISQCTLSTHPPAPSTHPLNPPLYPPFQLILSIPTPSTTLFFHHPSACTDQSIAPIAI